MKATIVGVIVFVTINLLLPEGDAECCRAGLRKVNVGGSLSGVNAGGDVVCHDCTFPTPCCATGKCNIFCCNCDGHCRGGCRVSRALGWVPLYSDDSKSGTGHDVVQDGDLDGDGRLSFAEAHHYVSKRSTYDADTAERMLVDMDMDNDNFFSPEEIDY